MILNNNKNWLENPWITMKHKFAKKSGSPLAGFFFLVFRVGWICTIYGFSRHFLCGTFLKLLFNSYKIYMCNRRAQCWYDYNDHTSNMYHPTFQNLSLTCRRIITNFRKVSPHFIIITKFVKLLPNCWNFITKSNFLIFWRYNYKLRW